MYQHRIKKLKSSVCRYLRTFQVLVYYPEYLSSVNELLAGESGPVVKAYIFYHLMFGHSFSMTSKTMREVLVEFIPGVKAQYSDLDCAKVSSSRNLSNGKNR